MEGCSSQSSKTNIEEDARERDGAERGATCTFDVDKDDARGRHAQVVSHIRHKIRLP